MPKAKVFYVALFIGLITIRAIPAFGASPVLTEHFRIMGFGGEVDEANLKRIARDLESAYLHIANFFGVDPYRASKIEVSVFLKSQAGRHIRAGATASRIELDADFNDIRLLRHELTHILIAKSISTSPRWFHEGLAQYMSGGDIRQARGHSLLPFKDFSFMRLEAKFGADLSEGDAYYYAWSIVSYLIDEYGEENLKRLFKESGFLKDRFSKAYGIELDTLEKKSNEIFNKYRPKAQ